MTDTTNHPSSFSLPRYKSQLETTVFGRKISFHKELNSTNSFAKNLESADLHHGLVIVTNHQTGGRGRTVRTWFSPPGKGLTFSLVITPRIPVRKAGLLPIMAGVAVAESLTGFGLPARLKWPNDVIVNNRKIAGILCESRISGTTINSVIMGIGLNVNDDPAEYPPELQSFITSFRHATGNFFSREDILANILSHLEKYYNLLDDKQDAIIIKKWMSYSNHIGKRMSFHRGDNLISGLFSGITPFGEAIIEIDGKQEIVSSGQFI